MSSVTFMYLLVSNFVQKIRKMLWANTEQTILQTEEFDEFINPPAEPEVQKWSPVIMLWWESIILQIHLIACHIKKFQHHRIHAFCFVN